MKWIFKLFIDEKEDVKKPAVKAKYGKVASIVGILLNLFLFLLKFSAGLLTFSISLQADALNNLADAGSSIISLVSIIYANQPADEEHPYGHERMEYIGSFIVSLMILLFAYELFVSSFKQILHPVELKITMFTFISLIISILIKLYMYSYNRYYGEKIDSSVMHATSLDSLSDALGSSVVLVGLIVSYFTSWHLDGYLGVLVALWILKAGIELVKDTLDEIVGEAPDPSLIDTISKKLLSYEGVLGIHDLVVHSYGSNRIYVSVHAEVSAKENILVSHDLMDTIEKDFKVNDNIDLVIHMDPIEIDDPFTNELRERCIKMIKEIDERLSLHDFRVVRGHTHNNLIFDVVVPFKFPYKEEELLEIIEKNLPQNDNGIINFAVVTLDQAYTSKVYE